MILIQILDLTAVQATGFSSYYNELVDSEQDSIVPEDIAKSAYHLVGATYIQNDVSDYISKNQMFNDN